jgi:hypothetical protein
MVNGHRMAKKSKTSLKNGKEPTKVGKELVKRTKNLNKNIETIMGKTTKTKSESFDIERDLVMYLYDGGDNRERYIRVDFNDYYNHDDFCMILDVKKLKGMADFIYKYLENK